MTTRAMCSRHGLHGRPATIRQTTTTTTPFKRGRSRPKARFAMRTRDVALATLLLIAPPAAAEGPGLGEPLANSEIPFFAAYVRPDGHGLPAGKGDAAAGAEIWANACAMCHGPTGNEGPVQPVVRPSASYP